MHHYRKYQNVELTHDTTLPLKQGRWASSSIISSLTTLENKNNFICLFFYNPLQCVKNIK